MNKLNSESDDWEASSARNTVRLRYWTLAWVLTTALAAFGPKLIWDYATIATIGSILLNLAIGGGMVFATKRHVQGLDELQQKIFLDAGALSLGVGLVFGLSYDLLEDVKLISFQPEIAHLVILMCLTFLAGTIVGHRKYR